MEQKLKDFSSDVLISAIEESLWEFWGNWGSAPGCERNNDPNLLRFYTGIPFSFCNGVITKQLLPEEQDRIIEETVSYFRDRDAIWEWAVGPNTSTASLETALEKHGLISHGESAGMAIDLRKINPEMCLGNSLSIMQATDEDSLNKWANTMIEGFESPILYNGFVELECSLGGNQQEYRRYIAYLNNQPVATSALYLGERVAGIYCVSTLPSHRRKGIGAIITKYALCEALSMGYNIAVLQATEIGKNLYSNLGFQELSSLHLYSLEK